MEKPLWKEIIKGSEYDGVTIPYMVGQFYQRNVISNDEIQTTNCIKIVLENIVRTANIGNEAAILLCDKYNPYIPMIQLLDGMERNSDDIITIKNSNPSIKNNNGDPVLYLQIDMTSFTSIESLAEYFWQKYKQQIKNHRFSVRKSSEIQEDGTYHIWEQL